MFSGVRRFHRNNQGFSTYLIICCVILTRTHEGTLQKPEVCVRLNGRIFCFVLEVQRRCLFDVCRQGVLSKSGTVIGGKEVKPLKEGFPLRQER